MTWQETLAWADVALVTGLMLGIIWGLNNISRER